MRRIPFASFLSASLLGAAALPAEAAFVEPQPWPRGDVGTYPAWESFSDGDTSMPNPIEDSTPDADTTDYDYKP